VVFANFSGAVFANSSSTRFNPVKTEIPMNFYTDIENFFQNTGGTIKNSDVNITNISFYIHPVPTALNKSPSFYSDISIRFPIQGYCLRPDTDITNVPILL